MMTMKTSSTESMNGGVGTPLTSPSEVTSPMSPDHSTKTASEHTSAFQSDPSLPALLSGASSVSADMEAELLGRPGIVGNSQSIADTTDTSLTPPINSKDAEDDAHLDQVFGNPPAMESGQLTLHLEPPPPDHHGGRFSRRRSSSNDGDDDDGSDDDILLMAKSKRKSAPGTSPARPGPFEARRRDTNISTTSVETARPPPSQDTAGTSDSLEPL